MMCGRLRGEWIMGLEVIRGLLSIRSEVLTLADVGSQLMLAEGALERVERGHDSLVLVFNSVKPELIEARACEVHIREMLPKSVPTPDMHRDRMMKRDNIIDWLPTDEGVKRAPRQPQPVSPATPPNENAADDRGEAHENAPISEEPLAADDNEPRRV
ncbi:hypothetical protein R1sor_022075 [Riccia sorocarpa]|uniref:Uncharacterized protein n=1 Tax=Riccia sorocarpa TaxID=122646 RepID=A0ABD3GN37_9MARC